jgi:hypothetical protein
MQYILLLNGGASQLAPADRVVIARDSNGAYTASIIGLNAEGGRPKAVVLNGAPRLVGLEDGLRELAALAKPT